MAGILDKKLRLFDSFITQEGRRQLGAGKMKAEFYSFTDGMTFYTTDTIVSGSSNLDETDRICFEATSLPQDQVTLEADDSGRLMAFPGSGLNIAAGQIYSGSTRDTTFLQTGSAFTSLSENLLTSASIDSFSKLRILGTPDLFDQNFNEFLLGNTNFSFTITDTLPIDENGIKKISIEHAESLFMDKRMSHVPNFRYLPPVNKAPVGGIQAPLGLYPSLGQAPIATTEDLNSELKFYDENGFKQEITFFETSKENNLVCQMFEVSGNEVLKLDVIDFGLFSQPTNQEHPTKHVFFAGKLFIDAFGATTFVNLFTLVFD